MFGRMLLQRPIACRGIRQQHQRSDHQVPTQLKSLVRQMLPAIRLRRPHCCPCSRHVLEHIEGSHAPFVHVHRFGRCVFDVTQLQYCVLFPSKDFTQSTACLLDGLRNIRNIFRCCGRGGCATTLLAANCNSSLLKRPCLTPRLPVFSLCACAAGLDRTGMAGSREPQTNFPT